MHQTKETIPTKIDSPGAVARQQRGFGSVSGYDELSAEYFTLAAGTDLTALLEGLEDDTCQCPHWGYVLEGTLIVGFTDGSEETDAAGDLFYWPPGHTVRADEDSDFVLFSPQDEHTEVLEHILAKMAADAD